MPRWHYSLRIVGDPAPKGSWDIMPAGRGVEVKGERYHRVKDLYLKAQNSDRLARWTHAIELAVLDAGRPKERIAGAAVSVVGTFFMEKPCTTKYPDYPLGPPDLDKLARALGDVLTRAYYKDDAQIVEWHIRKRWAVTNPGALITLDMFTGERQETLID